MEGQALERYLLDYSMEDFRQVRELWKSLAARKELIDFKANDARLFYAGARGAGLSTNARSRQYGYRPESMTYYQEGRAGRTTISQRSIKSDVNRFALGVQIQQRELMNQMMNGTISPQQWYDETSRLMKLSYRTSVTIARGTDEEMTEEEKKKWLLLLLLLFLLLNNFAEDLEDGDLPFDGRLPMYAGSLGSATRSLFENWRLGTAITMGYTEGRRVLGVAEHCEESRDRPGCVELSELGWIPIQQVTKIGDATCRQNCRCVLQFRTKPKTFGSL